MDLTDLGQTDITKIAARQGMAFPTVRFAVYLNCIRTSQTVSCGGGVILPDFSPYAKMTESIPTYMEAHILSVSSERCEGNSAR